MRQRNEKKKLTSEDFLRVDLRVVLVGVTGTVGTDDFRPERVLLVPSEN